MKCASESARKSPDSERISRGPRKGECRPAGFAQPRIQNQRENDLHAIHLVPMRSGWPLEAASYTVDCKQVDRENDGAAALPVDFLLPSCLDAAEVWLT